MSANWSQYFEVVTSTIDGNTFKYYRYKDKSVKSLPDNLPMPPTTIFYKMFYDCYQLKDISALANWNVSNVKDMGCMFHDCYQLKDISALANWNVFNVKDMGYMFHDCYQLRGIFPLFYRDMSKVEYMSEMIDGCSSLPPTTQHKASSYIPQCTLTRTNSLLHEADQQNSDLQKENTELKARLAYLEEKMDSIMSALQLKIEHSIPI